VRPTVGEYAKPALCASGLLVDGAAEHELVQDLARRRTVSLRRLARHCTAGRPFAAAVA